MVVKQFRTLLIVFVTLSISCSFSAVQQDKPDHPAELKQKVDDLIQKLGNDKYAVREQAQAEIETLLLDTKTFDALLAYLKQQMDATQDMEVKVRLECVTKLYLEFGITSSFLEKFPEIIKQLTSPNEETRIEIVMQLWKSKHPDAVNVLARMLSDESRGVCDLAIIALGEVAGAKAVEPLIKAVSDGIVTGHDVIDDLCKIGEPAVKPLMEALRAPDWQARFTIAVALSNIRDEKAVGPLIDALGAEDANLRSGAALALGMMKDMKALEPLIKALGDANDEVRSVAAEALGEIKSAKAVKPLIKTLDDADAIVRREAAWALGKIKDANALTHLIKALDDANFWVRRAAADSLGKLRDSRAVEPLIKVLADVDPVVRYAAGGALGEIRDTRAVEPLIRALRDPEVFVHDAAVESLGKIGKPALDSLKAAFENEKNENIKEILKNIIDKITRE